MTPVPVILLVDKRLPGARVETLPGSAKIELVPPRVSGGDMTEDMTDAEEERSSRGLARRI